MQGYLGTPITRRAGGRLGAPAINSGGLGPPAVQEARDIGGAAGWFVRSGTLGRPSVASIHPVSASEFEGNLVHQTVRAWWDETCGACSEA